MLQGSPKPTDTFKVKSHRDLLTTLLYAAYELKSAPLVAKLQGEAAIKISEWLSSLTLEKDAVILRNYGQGQMVTGAMVYVCTGTYPMKNVWVPFPEPIFSGYRNHYFIVGGGEVTDLEQGRFALGENYYELFKAIVKLKEEYVLAFRSVKNFGHKKPDGSTKKWSDVYEAYPILLEEAPTL